MNAKAHRDGITRRRFLRATGAGVGGAFAVGCDRRSILLWPFNQPDPEVAAFIPPSGAATDLVVHCLNRLTFGTAPGDYQRIAELAPGAADDAAEQFIEEQLDPRSIDDSEADRATRGFEYPYLAAAEHFNFNAQSLLYEMLRYTIARAAYSRRQLQEVMVQFWSDHFNIDSSKGDCRWLKASDDRDVIRRHALGSFPEMLRASALSPAMLWYLDGRVNRRRSKDENPNENYARELLELHTLGVHGGYSQNDVMEVARALTGWTTPHRGELKFGIGLASVKFNKKDHDEGAKAILGHAIPAGLGEKEIDRVLEIVCGHPSTATHIATKLCQRFIADDAPPAAVESVARAFADSGGDITATLRALFGTEAFRSPEFRGNKIRRPFNFIVACLRATGAKTDAREPLIRYLHRMGHAPFHFPSPDGYPEEPQPWMATLLWRWNFALRLARGKIDGTGFRVDRLSEAAAGDDGLMRHFLGRTPTPEESAAYGACDDADGLALLMASPAFQSC